MANEPLSEHCSLMARPGGPPKPKERPADCPKDAAYIKMTDAGGDVYLRGDVAPFPVVLEGGAGDDKVTVVGSGKAGVIVDGGAGNDSITAVESWTWLASRGAPAEMIFVLVFVTVFATIALLGWRALGGRR